MVRTSTFHAYERDRLGEDELYTILASQFSLPASHVASVFRPGRATWQVHQGALNRILQLKRTAAGTRVYGVWNVSSPDWGYFIQTPSFDILAAFDEVLTSALIGQRMPSPAFYHRLLELIDEDVRRTAFLSMTVDHIIAAKSLGMTGVHYAPDDAHYIECTLRTLTRDAVTDGEKYLRNNAGRMWSVTDTGVEVKDNFNQFLILEVTGDPCLVNLPRPERKMQYFVGSPVLTTAVYPADLDTTSIACTVMGDRYSEEMKNCVMYDMVNNMNENKITLTYYDPSRPRVDHVVCVNVLTFFHANGRVNELPEMLDWVVTILRTRAYSWGTHYYLGADIFLYFLSRLLAVPLPLPEHIDLAGLLKERIVERFGEPGDASALAMRILVATSLGLQDRRGYARLLAMQDADGAWPTGWIYRYGVSGVLVGNRGLTTALAVAAIRRFRELQNEN